MATGDTAVAQPTHPSPQDVNEDDEPWESDGRVARLTRHARHGRGWLAFRLSLLKGPPFHGPGASPNPAFR